MTFLALFFSWLNLFGLKILGPKHLCVEAQSFKDVSWWFFLFEKNNADFMVFNETAEWHWHHGVKNLALNNLLFETGLFTSGKQCSPIPMYFFNWIILLIAVRGYEKKPVWLHWVWLSRVNDSAELDSGVWVTQSDSGGHRHCGIVTSKCITKIKNITEVSSKYRTSAYQCFSSWMMKKNMWKVS